MVNQVIIIGTKGNLPLTDASLSLLKKNIRNSQRILKRNLPANIRLEHEKRIQAHLIHLEAKVYSELERKMTLDYKMVRFIEKKKALRKLKANADNQQAQFELFYIQHFPKVIKYISIYNTDSEPTPLQIQIKDELKSIWKEHPNMNNHEWIQTELLKRIPELLKSVWKKVLNTNETFYQQFGMNKEEILEQRMNMILSENHPLIHPSKQENNNQDNKEQDAFFIQ